MIFLTSDRWPLFAICMKALYDHKSMELFAFLRNIDGILRYVFCKAYTELLFSKPWHFYSLYILMAFQNYFCFNLINLKTNKLYEIIRLKRSKFGQRLSFCTHWNFSYKSISLYFINFQNNFQFSWDDIG